RISFRAIADADRSNAQGANLAMPQTSTTRIPLSNARAEIDPGLNYEVLRRAVERLGITDKDERGRRLVPIAVVKAFKASRQASVYLPPRPVRPLADPLARKGDAA